MLFNQLPLNKKSYIDVEQLDRKNLLDYFDTNTTLRLPVVQKGKLIGILNGSEFFTELGANKSPVELIQTDIIQATIDDKIDSFLHAKQPIIPITSMKKEYIGYFETKRLLDWNKFEREVDELKQRHYQKLQNYQDLQEEYDSVLQSSNDVIHIIDGKGKTLRISNSCESIDGIKKEKVIGQNLKEMVDNLVYSKSVGLEVLKHKKPITLLQKVQNGKEIIATGTPVFKDKKLFRVIVNARDITKLNRIKSEIENVQKMKEELQLFRSEQMKMGSIVVSSEKMREVYKLASRVASVDSTVLIQGESGVGKGVISKYIHQNSKRANNPFIKIDVSTIPDTLLEAELFGYVKGAFTGADGKGKIGLIELADKGTLFLDEIGNLPLNLQSKILQLIQDQSFYKVGGKNPIYVDIRIITATNNDLKEMIENQTFRKDLFYRLHVVPLRIPPLREHKDDIQPIIFDQLNKINKKYEYKKKMSAEALDCLLQYYWPGNIRELENVIERLVVMAEGENIQKHELPDGILNYSDSTYYLGDVTDSDFKTMMDEYEKDLLLFVKEKSKSMKDMAKTLKLDRSTIHRKLKKHKIEW